MLLSPDVLNSCVGVVGRVKVSFSEEGHKPSTGLGRSTTVPVCDHGIDGKLEAPLGATTGFCPVVDGIVGKEEGKGDVTPPTGAGFPDLTLIPASAFCKR